VTVFYWILFIAVVLLMASASAFSVMPLVFLAGGAVLGLGYLSFLAYRKLRSGLWEHSTYKLRFGSAVFLYFVLYWTTVGVFTNVKETREFWVRSEPYLTEGKQRGYTFYYLDYKNAYERIDSPKLNRYIEEKNPEKMKLVLEIVKDFGKLRAYSVHTVEAIPVNNTWIDGKPPWEVLRGPKAK
jgi:hypothetical protein